MRTLPGRLSIAALVMLALGACSGPTTRFRVPEGAGEKFVAIEAESFRFEPNEILARQGDILVLQVSNGAGIDHNLTVEDPMGEKVLELELPEGATGTGTVRLSEKGVYRFYCDKPLHPSFGMTGRIVVD